MSFEVRPYFVINSLYSPDSPKVSLTPTIENGTGYELDVASATALPSSPIIFRASDAIPPTDHLASLAMLSATSNSSVYEYATPAEIASFLRDSQPANPSFASTPQP